MTNIIEFKPRRHSVKNLPYILANADTASDVIDMQAKGVHTTQHELDTNSKLLTETAQLGATTKRPKRLIATLTVTAFSGKQSKKVIFPLGTGVLRIGDEEITHKEPIILGTAAGIAGVTSVILKAEGLPEEGIKLLIGRKQRELELLESSVKYCFYQFRTGYDIVKNSATWCREAVDRCEDEHWAPACELLPPENRRIKGLCRGVYGDDGWPLTARQIERQARGERFLAAFKDAINCRI